MTVTTSSAITSHTGIRSIAAANSVASPGVIGEGKASRRSRSLMTPTNPSAETTGMWRMRCSAITR